MTFMLSNILTDIHTIKLFWVRLKWIEEGEKNRMHFFLYRKKRNLICKFKKNYDY